MKTGQIPSNSLLVHGKACFNISLRPSLETCKVKHVQNDLTQFLCNKWVWWCSSSHFVLGCQKVNFPVALTAVLVRLIFSVRHFAFPNFTFSCIIKNGNLFKLFTCVCVVTFWIFLFPLIMIGKMAFIQGIVQEMQIKPVVFFAWSKDSHTFCTSCCGKSCN